MGQRLLREKCRRYDSTAVVKPLDGNGGEAPHADDDGGPEGASNNAITRGTPQLGSAFLKLAPRLSGTIRMNVSGQRELSSIARQHLARWLAVRQVSRRTPGSGSS